MDYSNLVLNSYLNSTPYSPQSFEFSAPQNQFEISQSQYNNGISSRAQSFFPISNLAVNSSPPLYTEDTLMNSFYSTRPNYYPSSSQKTWASHDIISYEQDSSSPPNSPTSPTYHSATFIPEDYTTTNVYIRLLPPHATDTSLHSLCSSYGSIISVRTLYDEILPLSVYDEFGIAIPPQTNESGRCCTGIGFVLFYDIDSAIRCVKGLNEKGFEASLAKESITHKIRRLADTETSNLYISNLPPHFTENLLIKLFLPDEVKCVRLLRDTDSFLTVGQRETGPNRGIGFARLVDREAADMAIKRLNNTWLPESTSPLRLRFADSVEQKQLKAQLPNQTQSRLDSKSLTSHTFDFKKLYDPTTSSTYTPTDSSFTSPSHSNRNRSSSLSSSASTFSMTTTTPNNSPTRLQTFDEQRRDMIRKSQELRYGVPPALNLLPRV